MRVETMLDAAQEFLARNGSFSIVSHTDADGLCAASIMQRVCERLGKSFEIRFLDQVSTLALARVPRGDPVIFCDLGSQHFEAIKERHGEFLIVDHHQCAHDDPRLCNPVLAGEDGTRHACTASLAWALARRLGVHEGTGPVALVGAQADHQEPFSGVNAEVLASCLSSGEVVARKGARLYGIKTRPLAKLLAYSHDLQLFEGSVGAALRFLDELGIAPSRNGRPVKYGDLTAQEQGLLDAELIRRSPNPHAQITHYTITAWKGSLADTREAATLLNACGKLARPHLALDILRSGDSALASRVHRDYGFAVKRAHEWYSEHGGLALPGTMVINAKDQIPPLLAGTLCSILVRGNQVPEGTAVICLARCGDGTTKVSARTSGSENLAERIGAAAAAVGGEGGGHAIAAGAVIPTEEEERFIDRMRN